MHFYENETNKTASYLRISRDDGDKAESDSIGNQRELVKEYIRNNKGLNLTAEYVDDGFSGTTFERPDFLRMMEDAKQKRINCILVKDLSRLGRNYIETGRYLEKIFPALGIRFISITDYYDSAEESGNADEIIIPFKNLINDAYCRDISIKIRSQLDVKRKNGKFIGSFAGYGYIKDPNDKNHLLIDEYAAEIVRLIFGMKLDGYSQQHIAEKLNEMSALPPLEYKRSCGLNFNSGFRAGSCAAWNVVTVNRILKNELYTGMMVQGKNRKINYKVKKSNPIEESSWIRVTATHDAIIPTEIFQTVQELMKRDTRTAPGQENVYVLSGFVRCGDCGQNMVHRCIRKNGKQYSYLYCSTNKRGGACDSHIVSEEKILYCVLQTIKQQIATVVQAEKIVAEMERLPQEQYGVKALNLQMGSLQAELERYRELKTKLYQDMLEGVVSKQEYQEINSRFTAKSDTVRTALENLEKRREWLLACNTTLKPWMASFKRYRNIESLDRAVLAALVDAIIVYDKAHIEVQFRYRDEIAEMLSWTKTRPSGVDGIQEARVG